MKLILEIQRKLGSFFMYNLRQAEGSGEYIISVTDPSDDYGVVITASKEQVEALISDLKLLIGDFDEVN